MSKSKKVDISTLRYLPKTRTGIFGLDEITEGGLPTGRPTLVCGDAGCGKSLLALEFIFKGATMFNEPGVFVSFEETEDELKMNVASLGFDLDKLVKSKKIKVDHVHIDRSEIEETGEYDLDGLFIRLGYAIDSIGAKRVVLDTIENLFSGLSNVSILRSELRRLFGFLKEKKVTAIITGERGDGKLTRQGLEEYVSDCVILLDNRVTNQISTRRLRIVKYRGSVHGTNEYPFLIDEDGISILPVTSLLLNKKVSLLKVSSGVKALDEMLSDGFYKGSSILVSGTAGTGKTSISACFANETCEQGNRCLYFAFEESPDQIVRNMKSINMNLDKHIKSGLLKFHASRPTLHGLEEHLVIIYKMIRQFKPTTVILDPITNLITIGSVSDVKSILIRLIDFLQNEQITVMFTALTLNSIVNEQTDEGVSSLVDTWLLVRDIEHNGERNRGMYIMKSRGTKHSNQIREFLISNNGLDLVDVFLGPDGVLTGSAREAFKLMEKTTAAIRMNTEETKKKEISRKEQVLNAQIEVLRAEFETTKENLNKVQTEEHLKQKIVEENNKEIVRMRNGTQNKKSK